jgi:hypothetical protein
VVADSTSVTVEQTSSAGIVGAGGQAVSCRLWVLSPRSYSAAKSQARRSRKAIAKPHETTRTRKSNPTGIALRVTLSDQCSDGSLAEREVAMEAAVEIELKQFVSLINKMTGITNSFDFNHCIDMFERLNSQNIRFAPEEIRAWLVKEGELLDEDAEAVKEMAQKFRDGKRVNRR